MGPGDFSSSHGRSSNLPSRPKYSWDMRNCPWTDGRGDQSEYARNVRLWKSFHDLLPASNSNKIPKVLQGIMLQSQLFGRALDLSKSIPQAEITAKDGAEKIVNAIYKRDPLAVVQEVYSDFIGLLSTKRGEKENFRNFESRFQAQLSKFNSHWSDSCFPPALSAFIMLSNSSIDNAQRISILASCTPKGDDANISTTEEALDIVTYESVASILRQCEKKNDQSNRSFVHSNFTKSVSNPRRNGNKRFTPAELQERKNNSQCRYKGCNKFGHWWKDHNPDGSLKPGVKSFDNSSVRDNGSSTNTVKFSMCQLSGNSPTLQNPVGPLLDDGAPYSGIGLDEFKLVQNYVCPEWNGKFEGLPDMIKDRPYLQYGLGSHSSKSRRIIGSVDISCQSDQGNRVQIRHLVIEGSSQWVIGRNVTRNCNILRQGSNTLELPNQSGTITLKDHDLHCYVPFQIFCKSQSESQSAAIFCAMGQLEAEAEVRPWNETKAILDKVHRHVCGHSSFTDMKILLQRNNLWDNNAEKYLREIMETCSSCHTTALPKPSRKVTLSSLSRDFNDVVCVDHLFLDDICVFHIMDTKSRYSVGDVVNSTNMMDAIEVFEAKWLSEFWNPQAVSYDQAFETKLFTLFLDKYGIEKRPLPSRRHNKNVIESKHRIIRDVYLRLAVAHSEDPTVTKRILVQKALSITNNLYGNDVSSAYELAKGMTRPVVKGSAPSLVPKEILEAHENLKAKRKLTLILRSKSLSDNEFQPGSIVQVFIKREKEKRGKWSGNKVVLEFDNKSKTVTVPGVNGKRIKAGVEDVRMALPEKCFSKVVQDSIDVLDRNLEDLISNFKYSEDEENHNDESESSQKSNQPIENENDDFFKNDIAYPKVGDSIEVFWPDDNLYYRGNITSFDDRTTKCHVNYDDGDQEDLVLQTETWKFSENDTIVSNGVELSPSQDLSSIEKEVLEKYYKVFGSKEFMIHQASGLPSFLTENAYKKEEESFTKTVRKIHASRIPIGSNVITSHVLYKVKTLDDGSKMLKARIAPHGNKDRDKNLLKKDSATCSPVGIRILFSIAVIKKWYLAKIDFKSAFLQSGNAIRDVYVIPPKECKQRFAYWLLLTAAYGLVNASAKWQEEIDASLKEFGYEQCIYIPQLFYKKLQSGDLSCLAVKIVDDVIFASETNLIRHEVEKISKRYKVGTIVYTPGSFLFNGLSVTQEDDFSISVDAEQKLQNLQPLQISRLRRKQFEDPANAIELSSYRSLNGSLGWIGVAASPFCSLASSILQQNVPDLKVKHLIQQSIHLKMLQKHGTTIRYKQPSKKGEYGLSIVVFSDASRSNTSGQIGHFAGLVIGKLEKDSAFHTISWTSRKSKRPVRSIGSAETIAASSAIDEGKLLRATYQFLMNMDIDLKICVDSKDLWDSLTTCHEPTDKSVKADVNVIRFEFETKNITSMTWIPGKINPADCLTKKDSPMSDTLQLMMFVGNVPIDFSSGKTRDSTQSTG